MNALDYAFHHAGCVWRMIKGDASALKDMDISGDGFWRSFAAIGWSLPALFFILTVDLRIERSTNAALNTAEYILTDIAYELIAWLLPVALLAAALRMTGHGSGFAPLIIVRNWFFLIGNYVVAALYFPTLVFGMQWPLGVLLLAFVVVFSWALIRLTRMAVPCDTILASALVIGEILIIVTIGALMLDFGGQPQI